MIVNGNDTLVALTTGHVIKVNQAINRMRSLEEENFLLQQDSELLEMSIEYYKKIINANDSIISIQDMKYEYAEGLITSLRNDMVSERKKAKRKTVRVGIVSALVGAITGILLTK